ncbi:MAG TPA: hypothetical protein VNZ61_09300 [Roseomonas sp.]|nr:hypothetical protein [Roseomonas sp.]
MPSTSQADTAAHSRTFLGRPERSYLQAALAAVLALGAFAAIGLWEKHTGGTWDFADRAPTFDLYALGRSLLALALSVLVILPFIRGGASSRLAPRLGAAPLSLAWASLALSAVFIAIFVVSPQLFSELAREDRSVEWASALALFVASGLLLWSAARFWKARQRMGRLGAVLCASGAILFGLALFVVGMEEISWMQRIFDIQTPAILLEENQQKELNFHNLFTNAFELLYYGGSFIFLILLPFMREAVPLPRLLAPLAPLLPGRFTLAVSLPLASFNYDMWHLLPIKMIALMTLIILIRLASRVESRAEAAFFSASAVLLVLSQVLLLALGDGLVRMWDPTEYKELIIALGFAGYAGEVVRRSFASAATPLRRAMA